MFSSILPLLFTLLFYALCPLLALVMFIMYLKLKFIHVVARRFKRVSSPCHFESEQHMLNSKVTIFLHITINGNIDFQDIVIKFKNRVLLKRSQDRRLLYKILQKKIIIFWGLPFWIRDESFKLRNHVSLYYKNGRIVTTEELQLTLKEIHSQEPLDPLQASPWHLTVVHHFGDGDLGQQTVKTRLILAYHHVLGDGHTLFHMMSQLFDRQAQLVKPKTTGKQSQNICGVILRELKAPYDCACASVQEMKCPWSVKATKVRVRAASNPIPLNEVKETAKAARVGVTTVLIAAITQALALTRFQNMTLRPGDSFIGTMAIAVQKRMESDSGNPVLHSVVLNLPILDPSDSENILGRFQNVLLEGLSSWFVLPVFTKILSLFANLFRIDYGKEGTKKVLIMSNFPGPTTQLFWHSKAVDDIDFDMESTGNYLFVIGTLSYNGRIRFRVNADSCIISDDGEAAQVITNIENQIKYLCDQYTAIPSIRVETAI